MKSNPKTVDSIIKALLGNRQVSNSDYQKVYKICKKMSHKVFNHYGMSNIVYNPHTQDELVEDITVMSLVKALNGYKPSKKAKFLTYFYNKARSYTCVQSKKCYRRFNVMNTSSLDEYQDNDRQD